MFFVAIETSGLRGSLALFSDGVCLSESVFEEGLVHGRELTARLEETLAREGLKARALEGIAVGVGPGSYTGIRVGVTAAKSLAFALRIPLVAESSLCIIAANAAAGPFPPGVEPAPAAGPVRIAAILDARQSRFFAALFDVTPPAAQGAATSALRADAVRRLTPDAAGLPGAIVETIALAARGGAAIVAGDGADAFLRAEEVASSGAAARLARAPREWDVPRARVLGLLVAEGMAAARFDAEAVHALEPAYLRVTEAERRLAARRGS
jgi:tRNA threonylcarbamoyladenosine biosynthesis protein TsaB